jgi:hypothetical protein
MKWKRQQQWMVIEFVGISIQKNNQKLTVLFKNVFQPI